MDPRCFLFQYDVVPIQPSVVICSCSHPSMVRNHPDSCSPLAIPGASSCHCPSMEGPSSEARVDGASGSETQQAARAPQPKKKKPEDFKFGKILGEGSFSTVSIHNLESYFLWSCSDFHTFPCLGPNCCSPAEPENVCNGSLLFSSQGCPGKRAGNGQRICK